MRYVAWLVGGPWLLLADQAAQPSGSRCLLQQQQLSSRRMFQQGPMAPPPAMQPPLTLEMMANATSGLPQQPLQGSFASQPQSTLSSVAVAEQQPIYEIAMPAQQAVAAPPVMQQSMLGMRGVPAEPAVAAQPVMQQSMLGPGPMLFAMPPPAEYFQAQGMMQGQPRVLQQQPPAPMREAYPQAQQVQFQQPFSQMPVLEAYPPEQQQFQQPFPQAPAVEPYQQAQQLPFQRPQLPLQPPMVQMASSYAYPMQQAQQQPAQVLPWVMSSGQQRTTRDTMPPNMAMLQEGSSIVSRLQQPLYSTRIWDRFFGWIR